MIMYWILWFYLVLHGIAWYCMVLHMLSEVYVSFVIFGIVIFCMHEVVSNIHCISMHIIIKYSTAQYCMVSIVLQIVHTISHVFLSMSSFGGFLAECLPCFKYFVRLLKQWQSSLSFANLI